MAVVEDLLALIASLFPKVDISARVLHAATLSGEPSDLHNALRDANGAQVWATDE